ncbi:hemolysin family protein, partial [Streptomyces tendae]|uniref:hemolysin family protein n=1 Tax=Streptomyces tendae TaxID=1932 RepID=UPI0036BEEA4B
DGAVTGISVVLAFVLATVVQMVLGELAPKNLAIAVPERLAKSLAGSTLAYLKVVGPVVRIFDGAANKLLRKVGIEPVEELHHGATLEELGHLIGESHEQGELPRQTARLLDHALEFSERTLHEVMVPRADAVFVRKDATAAEAVTLIGKHGHSNYPVLGDHPDDVAGVLGVRELMGLPAAQAALTTAGAAARRPLLLPDTLPLPDAVVRMREDDDEFAVVLDEHGGVAGVVTYEDIAEELVGDIADESDTVTEVAVADGAGWLVDAGRRLDEVAEATGVELPEEDDYETVAGLIVDRLGRFPAIGDRLTVELPGGGSAVIDVRTLDRHVPERIRIERPAEKAEEQA